MSDTTVTIRGVDSRAWQEFQSGIVALYGNLYGNIGQEVTNALKFWLDRQRGRELAVSIPAHHLSVSYSDIGGLKKEIEMTRESIVLPLRHPELFRWLNLIPPKGVLIHGPRGTGKNILARAAVAEAKAWLYVLSIERIAADPNEMRLHGVFQKAKENAPSAILIPDLRILSRQQKGSGDPADRILGLLLTEMDALEDFGRVVVLGIASSPEEIEQSLRQKFQREIEVSLPDRQGRYEILTILMKKMPLSKDVDVGKLADMTDRYRGVLLREICQEAARLALRRSIEDDKITDEEIPQEKLELIKVRMDDFLRAFDSLKPEI